MNDSKEIFTKGQTFLQKVGFPKNDGFYKKHGVHFLNIAQFLGVINDNAFKFLIVFLFIALRGVEHSSEILFWVGVVYVLPFLLFSSAAGVLADHFSKQKMIVILKAVEILVMISGVFALGFKSAWACYTLLFLLSMQSAIFGPPKYSIIPELVLPKKIPKANGLVTSFTYLGIIFGTTLATVLTQITNRNYVLTGLVTVLIAIVGFISSLCIPYTEPKQSHKKINPLFVYEIYQTLKTTVGQRYLFTSIIGASFFLFVGAYFQLNIVPYAIESLGYSEIIGGYLFLITAIGIALGAYIAGKLCKGRPEIGLSCAAGLLLSLVVFLFSVSAFSLTFVIILLVLIGFAGGLFVVPFDVFIQTYAPEVNRGKIIAASNFLSFVGVLFAPFALYLFSGILHLPASAGFAIVGGIIAVYMLFIISKLGSTFISYISRKVLLKFYHLKLENAPFEQKGPYLVSFDKPSLFPLLLILGQYEDLKIFFIKPKFNPVDLILNKLFPVKFFYAKSIDQDTLDELKEISHEHALICIPKVEGLTIPNETHLAITKAQREITLSFSGAG